MGQLFHGKFLDGLREAYDRGALVIQGATAPLAEPAAFAKLVDSLYRTNWVVYSKRPFLGTEQVFRYLGRYTHRVGISNHRLQAFDENGVRFATKGGKNITLSPEKFIGRFLLHVLPAGFVKIRHFGLLASGNVNKRLPRARAAIAGPPAPMPHRPRDWKAILLALTGLDAARCPRCGGTLVQRPLPRAAAPLAHAPARTPAGADTS